MNISVCVKNQMIIILAKMIISESLVIMTASVIRRVKLEKI